MFSFGRLLVILILIWSALYAGSFGLWTWRKKNKLGAIMVFLVAIAVLVMPLYSLFFRQ